MDRNRHAPDLVPRICDWLEARGFDRRWLSEPDAGFGVGAHRFNGESGPLPAGERMFTFVGYDILEPTPHPTAADGSSACPGR